MPTFTAENTTANMSPLTTKPTFIQRLKSKWGVESALQVLLILIVFTLAGSTAVMLRKSFFSLIGFDGHTALWLKAVAYILFLFPAYQVLLLVYGTLLGQFRFFWAKERRMLLAVRKVFTGRET
jgi:hypothetical protein